MALIQIDGSYGEGGGQVLRTALALSTLTGQPMAIDRIRAGRRRPGLRPQHLAALRALAAVCKAEVSGDALDSQQVTFRPTCHPQGGDYCFDVRDAAQGGSAGSVTLIAQAILLPLAFAGQPSRVTLRGGTHVSWSPPYHYLQDVFVPCAARMDLSLGVSLNAWGWYPAGGGEICLSVSPVGTTLEAQVLQQRGEFVDLGGVAAVTNLPAHIPQRMANRANNLLRAAGLEGKIQPLRARGTAAGAGIFVYAQYTNGRAGFSALGRRGVPSEKVAEEVCRALLDFHRTGNAPVDPFLCDQLILPLALAQGESILRTSQLTEHARTVLHIVQQFLDIRLRIEQEGVGASIFIEGIGYHV